MPSTGAQPFRQILRDLGLTSNRVWGLTKTDEEWSERPEAALTTTRRDDLRHGTNAAYVPEETLARGFEVFGKWSPAEGSDFLQFLDRIDGRGGFAVVETEDPTLIARDTAVFGPFLNFNVYPVLDSQESARITSEAIEFRRSIG